MRITHLAALLSCALLWTACNRETTDQGGTSQESASGARQESGSSSTDRANRYQTPPIAQPDANTAPAPVATDQSTAKPADNTGRNVRDRNDATLTPENQSESASDLELARRIRQALTQTDQLSIDAKNIKVIANGGKVTLRGPVQSEEEKQRIQEKVQAVGGISSVDNQLEVKADTKAK